MGRWLKLLILFILAIVFALALRDSHGFFILETAGERRTVTLPVGVFLLILAFIVLYAVLRIVGFVIDFPKRFRRWRDGHRTTRDYDLLEKGWVEVLDGRYEDANADLSKLVNRSKNANRRAIASLVAAKLEHDVGHYDKRDQLLADATKLAKGNQRLIESIQTLKGSSLVDQGQAQEALAILEPLLKARGDRPVNLRKLVFRCYRQLNDHDKILNMARDLKRNNLLDEYDYRHVVENSASVLINMADQNGWQTLYKNLRSDERTLPLVALAIATKYRLAGDYHGEAKVLEQAIDKQFDARLVGAYAHVAHESQIQARLAKAQKWLAKDESNPELLNALGFLCLSAQLWGQAERYLIKSLDVRNDSRIHTLLGTLYDRLKRTTDAMKHWRIAALDSNVVNVFEQDSMVLPAADTSADPDGPPDRKKNIAQTKTIMTTSEYNAVNHEGDDALFDSAPIPGAPVAKK